MDTSNAGVSPMLNVSEAAAFLRLGVSTLNRMRITGGGPAYLKLGSRRVVYDKQDLDAWITERRRLSTSEQ